MPNINNKNVVPEAVTEVVNKEAVVAETPEPVKEKKPRKPREKVRDIEEIIELPVNKLTEKEKDKLINFFKDSINEISNKVEAYKSNAKAAYEQTRQMEADYKAMEAYYKKQLKFVHIQLEAFVASITTVTKGGEM